MSGDAYFICKFIEDHLRSSQQVSMLEVLAYYDWHNHVIPTVKQLNRGLALVSTPIALDKNGIYLISNIEYGSTVKLTDADLERIFELYIKNIHRKDKHT